MIVETALAFIADGCNTCKNTRESLLKDFLFYDISLSFIDIKRSADVNATQKAMDAGVTNIPGFSIGGMVFYPIYSKQQIELAVQNIKAKHNVV
jgi:hypothetical protein